MLPLLRVFRIISLLAAFSVTATGQTLPSPATSTAAIAPPVALTRADTARAIHELFRSRRGGGVGWLALGTVGILASTLPAQQTTSAGVWTPGVVAGSAFVLIGLNKRIQFRPGRERQVLRELATTGHLPVSVGRRLHGNFAPVHGSASEANPLLALPIASGVPAAGSPPASAPGAPVLAPATSTPAQQLVDARTDTLDAVRGLFLSRRGAGAWPLIVVLPVARILAGTTNTDLPNSSSYAPQTTSPSGGSVALGLGLMGAGLAYMLLHNAPYTQEHYQALSLAYSNGQPLPANIRQGLRARHLTIGRKYRQRQERRALRRSR